MSSQFAHAVNDHAMQEFEGLLSVNQAAKVLGISPKTVRHMVLTGRIEYVKLGARVLFRPEKLREMIEKCTVTIRKWTERKRIARQKPRGYNKRALTRKRAA